MINLNSFGDDLRVIIVGASGGIGQAFASVFEDSSKVSRIYALSRQGRGTGHEKTRALTFDFTHEDSISAAAEMLRETGPFDLIIIATGWLHGDGLTPEKNIRALSSRGFETAFAINTIGPAMTAKYFVPLLRRDRKTVFAALSARVGSISENRLGGWYAYRAAKAALNMVLKTLSIETARRYPEAVILGLHPGTVDTRLSAPFQNNVAAGKLFTPEFCARQLITVINTARPADSGKLIDWDGKIVPF